MYFKLTHTHLGLIVIYMHMHLVIYFHMEFLSTLTSPISIVLWNMLAMVHARWFRSNMYSCSGIFTRNARVQNTDQAVYFQSFGLTHILNSLARTVIRALVWQAVQIYRYRISIYCQANALTARPML